MLTRLLTQSGVTRVLINGIHRGVPVVIMSKFDPEHLCECIERYRISYVNLVPPVLLALLHHPGESISFVNGWSSHSIFSATNKYNLKSLNLLFSGAAPLSGHLTTAVCEKLRSVGANVFIGQGLPLCNCLPSVSLLPPRIWPHRNVPRCYRPFT